MLDFVIAEQYFLVAEPHCSVAAVEKFVGHSAPFVTSLVDVNVDGISVNKEKGLMSCEVTVTVMQIYKEALLTSSCCIC